MTILYGIKSCDTIKKARKWLENANISYQWHDYRTDGIDQSWLEAAEKQLGWQALINTRGTTYRQLDESQKTDLDKDTAIQLMLQYPAMIKRPILQHQGQFHLAFKPEQYQALFS